MSSDRYLVTGAMGCLGSWVIRHLLAEECEVVAFDLSTDDRRHQLIIEPAARSRIQYVQGDLTEFEQVLAVSAEVSHIIHLGALQVPFCRADRAGGAAVNVVGTVNVFEAALRRSIDHLVYASSVAAFGDAGDYPRPIITVDDPRAPTTLYGVWKCANESMAQVYQLEDGIRSIGLIPHTVYGPGRDQGLTSQPTMAILSAVQGRNYYIDYGGVLGFQYAPDVACAFIKSARIEPEGAELFGLGGNITSVSEFVGSISAATGFDRITHASKELPFPHGMDDAPLRARLGGIVQTSLDDSIEESARWFEWAEEKGLPLPNFE